MIAPLKRSQQRREDGLSASLQISKAAEHLACGELLLRGWNAFLADQGLPYDIVVDIGGSRVCRVQVKATTRMYDRTGYHPAYRFAIRRSRTGDRKVDISCCDYLAFVALDRRLIAWLPVAMAKTRNGTAKTLIEFKTKAHKYGRTGVTGVDPSVSGKFMEDFSEFKP